MKVSFNARNVGIREKVFGYGTRQANIHSFIAGIKIKFEKFLFFSALFPVEFSIIFSLYFLQ